MPPRTFLCQLLFAAVFSVSFINLSLSATSFFVPYAKSAATPHENLFCSQSGLADGVLVVLRTGATESRQKLPVHFRTTLRCVLHSLVVSDFNEEIDGHKVHDVLGSVSEHTRKSHSDFTLYHHLQKHGRQGLEGQEVITAQSGSSKGDYLNTENRGWSLDKWKFLPMIDRAYQEMPNAKWFVFIEADTYLNWNNLLEYLANFDASKPYYIGKHLYINDIEFGYGGAGVILSNPAVRKVREHRSIRVRDYEDFTASHWVGDFALGKILNDVRVPLHRAYPHLTADSPMTMDPATVKIDRDAWCYPVITYHHVSPSEMQALWDFEQDWYKRHDVLLRHRDVFMEHVRSQIRTALPEWDNMSADKEYNAHDHGTLADETERNAWKSFRHCHAVCEKNKDCVQFSYDSGSCSLSYSFRLGYAKPKERVRAGWMLDRVDDMFLKLETKCAIRDWFSPKEGPVIRDRRL